MGEYRDEGISAKSLTGRPAALAALEAVRAGQAAGLLVAKMDRHRWLPWPTRRRLSA